MLSRFSVKFPYIVVVAVIICLILGGVSLSKMRTDLLPDMDIPYLAVIVTDPGSSAEKIETELTEPLEGALAKVNGVTGVTSTSSNNYTMIFLAFEDGTDMDSAMVKVSSAVNQVENQLPDSAGAPNILEISMDMMATLYVAASYDGKNIYELSDFAQDTLVPRLERVDGVADVSVTGVVEQTVEVRLSDSKIEDINNEILAEVNDELADSKRDIDEAESELADAKAKIESQQSKLEGQQKETSDQLGQAISGLTLAVSSSTSKVSTLAASLQSLQAQAEALQNQLDNAQSPEEAAAIAAQLEEVGGQATAMQEQLNEATEEMENYQKQLAEAEAGSMSAASGFGSGQAQLANALTTIESNEKQLENARDQYKDARKQAIENANIDKLVDKQTLANLIIAQDFSMPAGYLGNNDDDEQWLLHVGDDIETVKQLKNLLLTKIDGVGAIRLKDVADITVVDNAEDGYMSLNGEKGMLLSVFKSSTASTNEVSSLTRQAIEKLESQYDGLSLKVMSDQGAFIDLYISTILQSLMVGALLAILVLLLFLRKLTPTLLVAVSIPFSVLLALLIMYFTGISLNIMSLGGISLAIGMLVDNSVVVMENIYRLRARGIAAPRAAVQGAKQISGAVVASTLTTICVFIPIAFTTGVVNQLLMPFALSLTYVLVASLVVALTFVPALARFAVRNYQPREERFMNRLRRGYGRSLNFFLRHKFLPLAVAVALVGVSVAGVINMGVTMIPSMTSRNMSINVQMPEDTEREEAFKVADEIMDAIMSVPGVETVTGIDGSTTVSAVADTGGNAPSQRVYELFSYNVRMSQDVQTDQQVRDIMDEIHEKTKDLPCEVMTDASSSSMTSMLGSGLSIRLTGEDRKKLEQISEDIMDIIKEVPGYTEVENGMEDADKELRLIVNEDKLTKRGMTVAQLYQALVKDLTTDVTSSEVLMDGSTATVHVIDETHVLTKDNILNHKVEITGADGETKKVKLKKFAKLEEGLAATAIRHVNSQQTMTITAEVEEGYNNALLVRQLQEKLDHYDMPDNYSYVFTGEIDNINTMLEQMMLLLIVGFVLIYLIMMAQFQGLLSPFIVIMTVPLAFTGGFFALWICGEQLNMLSLMGFAVLMGTVVNNGIVFVDYVNQLRRGGLEKRQALVAAGQTRMRPILMTALTTILAMVPLAVSDQIGASMERGMALVVMGGLAYATLMTLYIVPILYDIMYRRVPTEVDLGDENVDDDPGDAQAYLEQMQRHGLQASASESLSAAESAPLQAPASPPSNFVPAYDPSQSDSGVRRGKHGVHRRRS